LDLSHWLVSVIVPAFSVIVGFICRLWKCKYEADIEEEEQLQEGEDGEGVVGSVLGSSTQEMVIVDYLLPDPYRKVPEDDEV
jgi:hypothetical protein